MLRRHLLAGCAAGIVACGYRVGAGELVRRIGVLGILDSPGAFKPWLEALRDRGWIVGRNLEIEYRFHQGRTEQLPALAAELATLRPEVIVTTAAQPALAARTAAPGVPLVFVNVADPVGLGLVRSLAQPGGNATGLAATVPEGFMGKGMQLLKELVPPASRIAVLQNPTNAAQVRFRAEFPEVGQRLGITLFVVEAREPDQLAAAFDTASAQRAEAIVVAPDVMFYARSTEIVELAARHRIPAMYWIRQFVLQGGLLSFGTDGIALFRRSAAYIDEILRGAKPADLPVEQPTKYELVVNRKTADSLGLTIPPSILAQADEVIE